MRAVRSSALLAVAAVAIVAGGAAPAGAQAQLPAQAPVFNWTAPIPVDGAGAPTAITCPSSTECVIVDAGGNEVSFDPDAPALEPALMVDAGRTPSALASPSATQCTAVDTSGYAVTFDPEPPATTHQPVDIDGAHALYGVGCETTAASCTAIDGSGNAVVFDPGSTDPPPAFQITSIGSGELRGLSCADDGCVAVEDGSREVTFDALNPSYSPSSAVVDLPANGTLNAISCASDQCTTVDQAGAEATFEPGSPPVTPAPADIDSHPLLAVACPSTGYCIATDDAGGEVTFDPALPAGAAPATIDGGVALAGVACPSMAECVAVDRTGRVLVGGPVPVNITPPTAGPTSFGNVLSSTTGVWSGDPTTFSYGWQRCSLGSDGSEACETIPGADSATYALSPADYEFAIRTVVTAIGAGGARARPRRGT